jgi:hypothetical protein
MTRWHLANQVLPGSRLDCLPRAYTGEVGATAIEETLQTVLLSTMKFAHGFVSGASMLVGCLVLACGQVRTMSEEPTKSDQPGIPTVTYCDLVARPALYNNKKLRIRAVFSYGWEVSFLGDAVCDPSKPPRIEEGSRGTIFVDLEPYIHGRGDPDETVKKLQQYGVKDITVIGTFSDAMPRPYRLQFAIEHVERMAWIREGRY